MLVARNVKAKGVLSRSLFRKPTVAQTTTKRNKNPLVKGTSHLLHILQKTALPQLKAFSTFNNKVLVIKNTKCNDFLLNVFLV